MATTQPMPPKDKDGWFVITPINEPKVDCFRLIGEMTTEDLYSITAADKALAVPYIKLSKLKGTYARTNDIDGEPITNLFYKAPKFGESVESFAERPDASITSISIKKHNPGGWILFREIDLEVTVHRPDVLNDSTTIGGTVAALLQPGNNFYLEYGWQGGNTPILGKGQFLPHLDPNWATNDLLSSEQKIYDEYKKKMAAYELKIAPGAKGPPGGTEFEGSSKPTTPHFAGVIYESVASMRFIVTTYNFSIQPDGQFKFHIHGVEDGELQVRDAATLDHFANPAATGKERMESIRDNIMEKLKPYVIPEPVEVTKASGTTPAVVEPINFITVEAVLDTVFATPVRGSISKLNYDHVHLYTGVFNRFCCDTVPALGSQKTASLPIGMFRLRFDDVKELLNKIVTTDQQTTVANMMKQFLQLIGDHGNWVTSVDGDETVVGSPPELQIFTIFSPKNGYARFQIVDRKRYLSILRSLGNTSQKVTPEIELKKLTDKKNGFILDDFIKVNHLPRWKMYHRNSFFKSAKFEVTLEENMKSIFISRALKQRKDDIVKTKDPDAPLPMGLLIYRSAIKGTVTTIGNFGFDLLGQVWVDFGVDALSGIFYVLGKTDKITPEGFYSEITLQSEGSNPLESPETNKTDTGTIMAPKKYGEVMLFDINQSVLTPTPLLPPLVEHVTVEPELPPIPYKAP